MTFMESIPQRALSGAEIKAIMVEKFQFMLSQNTRLSDYMAYGRLAYDITVRIHVDNAHPIVDVTESAPIGRNIVDSAPELGAIESGPPLVNPSPKAETSGTRLSNDKTHPNLERLAHHLPIPVETRRGDGSVVSEEINYPVDYPIEKQKNVRLEDVSETTARELGKK